MPDAAPDNLLRIDEVIRRCGLSQPSIYRRMATGTFPRPKDLGGNSVRWPESRITAWIGALPDATAMPDQEPHSRGAKRSSSVSSQTTKAIPNP